MKLPPMKISRFIYFQLENMVVAVDGYDFDAHTATVTAWNAAETDHIFSIARSTLAAAPIVNVLYFDAAGNVLPTH